jgi:hypothetical protein
VKHSPKDAAAQVVAHLQDRLEDASSDVERLAGRWRVVRGIETGADSYSARIQKRLSEPARTRLAAAGARTRDPILELPPGAEQTAPWDDHRDVLARSPEPRALLYGAIDEDDYTNLVWLRSGDAPPQSILDVLETWREVLRTRAEFDRNPRRGWWETAWPRDREALCGPKVIALYRTDRGRFALDENGDWQPSNKATIVAPRSPGLSVAYLCGLLNSELLDLWYAVRGKIPRDVWRNYEPKPMNEMPYRHVVAPEGWSIGASVRELEAKLGEGDASGVVDQAHAIRGRCGRPYGDADAMAAIERLVRSIANNRRALLARRPFAPELGRAVKNPWRTHGVRVDPATLVSELAPADIRSVRLDPSLHVTITTDGMLGRPQIDDEQLLFRRARRITARVEGPVERLEFLEQAVRGSRLVPDELLSTLIPLDLVAYRARVQVRQDEIDDLLERGRILVEAVERLVCCLYGVPDDLTELVIESAVTRAGTVATE